MKLTANLNTDKFRNGDLIPEAKTNQEWIEAGKNKQPAWCYYDNKPENGEKYGKLYNWYAVNDARGLAPRGWHVPTASEINTLVNYLGGTSVAGGALKDTSSYWASPNVGATNSSGFTALPGGYREAIRFIYIGYNAVFWSSTVYNQGAATAMGIINGDAGVSVAPGWLSQGFSVRCIKD